jgi:hypothetical protein
MTVPFYRRYHKVCLTCEVESGPPSHRPIWQPAAGMDGSFLSVWSRPCHKWRTHTAFVRYEEKKSKNFSSHLQVAFCNIFHRTDCIKCVKELLITLYYCIPYRLVFCIGLWSPASHIGDSASVPDHRCGFCCTKCCGGGGTVSNRKALILLCQLRFHRLPILIHVSSEEQTEVPSTPAPS